MFYLNCLLCVLFPNLLYTIPRKELGFFTPIFYIFWINFIITLSLANFNVTYTVFYLFQGCVFHFLHCKNFAVFPLHPSNQTFGLIEISPFLIYLIFLYNCFIESIFYIFYLSSFSFSQSFNYQSESYFAYYIQFLYFFTRLLSHFLFCLFQASMQLFLWYIKIFFFSSLFFFKFSFYFSFLFLTSSFHHGILFLFSPVFIVLQIFLYYT